MTRNREIPLTEEVLRELENHKKVDGKRAEKGGRKQKRQKGTANSEAVLELDRQEAELERSNRKKKDDNKNNIAPVEIKSEVKIEKESQIQTGETSATERPEEKTMGDLERKKEKIEELEKKEKELLEIFEQNKNKAWAEKKDIITAAINELEKVRAEKAETEKEIADSSTSVQIEDPESDYDIAEKRKPTKEELEKLNPLLTKTTNTADVFIPEKFIEEKPGQQKTIEPLIANEETIQKEYEIAFEKTRIKNLESKLAAMENALKEKIEELTVKDATKLDKFKKFITNPKVKLAIGIGLIGAASVATGGGALVGAWLHLPYGLGISALGGTSNLTTALLGSGFIGRAYGDKIKNGFRENMKEILGIIKNEERIGNVGEAKSDEPQITQEKTEKPEGKKENFFSKIFGRRGNKDEEKPEGFLIKKTERMKKTAPETEINKEDKFDKKAEEAKDFVGQLKEGKKTGKEIYEYLVGLKYRFLHFDEINFNSKIKPEIDKLSKKEKTDMIDLAVEYLKMWEAEKKSVNKGGFEKTLTFVVYDKIGFTQNVYEKSGKPENVKWLYGNKS